MPSQRSAAPPPPAIFVGRDNELARLERGLKRVNVAVVYGVPGVGKSSLVSAFAGGWPGPVGYCRAVEPTTLKVLCDDLLRQLRRPSPRQRIGVSGVSAVAEKLDDLQALWLVDDLHRLRPEEQAELVRTLGSTLQAGRLLATSRELLPFDADGPDRLELKLGGLDATSSQSLWSSLDDLHGLVPGFNPAWSRARGNPLHLRQAHASRPASSDPIAAVINGFSASERRIAATLALSSIPLPTQLLQSVCDDGTGAIALTALITRMVLDPAGAGMWNLHDLFRDQLIEGLSQPEQHDMQTTLASLLARAELDPVLRVREICRHLCAVKKYEQIATVVLAEQAVLIAEGAAGELLRCLESIPSDFRSPNVVFALARTRARMLDLGRAQAELSQLPRNELPLPGYPRNEEVSLTLAQVALARGDLETCRKALLSLGDVELLLEPFRSLVIATTALAQTYAGEGELARQTLQSAEEQTSEEPAKISLTLFRAILMWMDDIDEGLDEVLRPDIWASPSSAMFRGNVLAPGLAAALLARQGRFTEADQQLSAALAQVGYDDDALTRALFELGHAYVLFERGERVAVEELLSRLIPNFAQGGHVVGSLNATNLRGRNLQAMGRRKEAAVLFDRVVSKATPLGLHGLVASAERARNDDFVAQFVRGQELGPLPPTSKRGTWFKMRYLDALRGAAAGDAQAVDAVQAMEPLLVNQPGYGLERALFHVAAATLAKVSGLADQAASALQNAHREIAGENLDSDLLPSLTAALGKTRAVTKTSRRLVTADPTASVVVDDASGEVIAKDLRISFKNRPMLRRLLAHLARHPGQVCTRDALTLLLWNAGYNPQMHDNPLKVSVARLRALLADTGLQIDSPDGGYRMIVPDGFVFLEPLDS